MNPILPITFKQIPSPGLNNPTFICQTPSGVLVLVFGDGIPALAHVPGVAAVESSGRIGLQSSPSVDVERADCKHIDIDDTLRIAGTCCTCGQSVDNPIICGGVGDRVVVHCEHWFQPAEEKGEDVK